MLLLFFRKRKHSFSDFFPFCVKTKVFSIKKENISEIKYKRKKNIDRRKLKSYNAGIQNCCVVSSATGMKKHTARLKETNCYGVQ